MTSSDLVNSAVDTVLRTLGGGGDSEFGVHIKYEDLWFSMIYLASIYAIGFLFERVLFCPALVGQITAGIVLGPQLANIVPFAEAFVLLGEIGLVLLVIEAGVDIDVTTLKLIGKRGVIIATIGSVLPIAIGLGIAFALGADVKAAIAAGASFGPTSLGIAMAILRNGKIINTPTGQLIVAAAIIDDMIALIILSQLGGLVGTVTAAGVLIPIISALCFLIIGGYIALFILPNFLESYIMKDNMSKETRGRIGLLIMITLVLGLMQATHYTKASHLMGAFIAGLVFCTDHDVHVMFVSQFKRVLQWLMRIFFASTIGFQVPITQFGSGKILGQGLLFTLALIGKLVVGFMVPNFTKEKNFTGNHLRDCLIVGCSMAAEGEFAFVIAAFAVDNGLIDKDLYSSVVLAILLSTIIAPFSLRFTISYFNKRALAEVLMVEEEIKRTEEEGDEEMLAKSILKGTAIFYCINTTCHAAWGTLPALMQALFELELEIIDHRSWHSKFESTVINEVYAKGLLKEGVDISKQLEIVQQKVMSSIKQKDSIVVVSRWIPGVLDEITEASAHGENLTNVSSKLAEEAQMRLNNSRHKEVTKDLGLSQFQSTRLPSTKEESITEESNLAPTRQKRVKVVSTPINGGDMFDPNKELFQPTAPLRRPRRRMRTMSTPISGDMFGDTTTVILGPGEVLVNVTGKDKNKSYVAKMKEDTFKLLSESGVPITLTTVEVNKQFSGQYLDGFVRREGRKRSVSNLSLDENKVHT